jgi:hypothetical protein
MAGGMLLVISNCPASSVASGYPKPRFPSFSRAIPFSVPLAKLGESNGKKHTLSLLVLFLPPLCLRLRGFELQNIVVGFIEKY